MDWSNHYGRPANPFQLHHPCSTSAGDPRPCLPCQRVANVESQILEATKALDELIIQLCELKTIANQAHNSFTHHLPTELLSHIFKLCLPCLPSDFDEEMMKTVDIYAPLKLGGVCSTWRQIVWSTPQFWTLVPIYFSRQPERNRANCGNIEAWMERAGTRPLHLFVRSGMGKLRPVEDSVLEELWPLIYLINTCFRRCQTLPMLYLERLPSIILEKIRYKKATPLLHWQTSQLTFDHSNSPDLSDEDDEYEEFDEDGDEFDEHSDEFGEDDDDSDEDEPDLSPMRVTTGRVPQKLVETNWSNLTVLFSTGFFSYECYIFLKNAPRLTASTFLDVAHDSTSSTTTISTRQPFTHLSLTHLKFHSCMEYTDHFLYYLTLPALKHLHFEFPGLGCLVTMFFRDPLTSLASLVLDVKNTDRSLFQCSQALKTPTLKRLMVSGFKMIGEDRYGTAFLTHLGKSCAAVGCHRFRYSTDFHSPVLPNLQHLTIQNAGGDEYHLDLFGWHNALIQFKKAFVDRDERIHSTLRSITLSLACASESDISRSCINKDVVGGFLDVIRSGVPLRIITDPGERSTRLGVDLIKSSMELHNFSQEDIEEYLVLAESIEVEEWQDWGDDSLLALS